MRKKEKLFTDVLTLVVIVFAICTSSCSNKAEESPKTKSSIKEAIIKETAKKPLYLGFIPQGNSVFMARKWQPLAAYLAQELRIPVELVFRSSYRDIIAALSKGEMDVCLTGAFMYVLAKEETDIRPLVRRKKFGSSFYNSIIIVRKDSGIKTIEALKGKRFAFTDKESTTGYLLPTAMMRQKGILNPEKFFSEVIYTGNHDSVLLAVYTKSVAGAAMSTTRWRPENPHINDLKIIWKSEPVMLGPFSVRGGLDERLVKRIKEAFLKIGKTPDTINLSKHIQIEGFEEAQDQEYDSIRKVQKWVF